MALIGASPGAYGTTLSQTAWLPVLRTLGTEPWFGSRLLVPRAAGVFDAEGALVSDEIRDRLQGFLAGFAAFAARRAEP